ncbi:hypothetical protein TIFTF001_017566 [Ficus carica]|uniref:Uncharacterized protein n=1 Tax=Ficus carica TaxID=3494 RepID=A0AA88A8A0_FICCA|nr:hypothetical protein TIFTF001_017566 [Ficus carica]
MLDARLWKDDTADCEIWVGHRHGFWKYVIFVTPTCIDTFCKQILKKWSLAYFNGWMYVIMTTNIAKSLNSVDRKASLGQLISLSTSLLQGFSDLDCGYERKDMYLQTLSGGSNSLSSCNGFHHKRIDRYNYCSHYYTKEVLFAPYEPVVHPISSAEGWDVSEEVRSQVVNPPKTKRGLGRPRVTRILSQGEELETIQCSRCHGYGHNQ